MSADDFGRDEFEVWPDNARALELFISIRTQWRVGPGGPYGLDYNVLYSRMGRMNLDPAAWAALESEIAAMESAALEVILE